MEDVTKKKEVHFDKYCPLCKHEKVPETKDPCNRCLTVGGKSYSHKPICFKSKED